MPKEEGGLGFHEIQKFNDAFLAKQLRRLVTQPNLLMSRVLKAKYFPTGCLLKALATNTSSWLWKCWIGAKYVLEMGLKYQMGDGKSIRIWEVPWLDNAPKFIPKPKQEGTPSVTWARELMDREGKEWNEELLERLFWPQDVITITNIPIRLEGTKDRLLWTTFNRKGVYTIQSAYQQLQMRDGQRVQQAGSSGGAARSRSMWKQT